MKMHDLAKRMELALTPEKLDKSPSLPGLTLYQASEPTAFEAMVYEPIVCLIVQGEKEVTVGEQCVGLRPGECVVVGHDLPVMARITKASPFEPYLSLILHLDLELLHSLEDTLEGELPPIEPRSLEVAPASDALVNGLSRALELIENPVEAQVLLPLVRKELHFRLLRSEPGGMLRALLRRDSHASQIAQAIRLLRDGYRESWDVPRLARSVGMSPSSFHRHFKHMTRTTPLQYQKDLRLMEARRLLRTGQSSVSDAAFAVGYESPSQFSREYSRKFGAAPRDELRVA